MKATIRYNSLFAYSEENKKAFYREFSPTVNIIYGRNTSGKSTLIQAIHYVFGINDERHKLTEILNEKVMFRLDFSVKKDGSIEDITIVRDGDFIYIRRANKPARKFAGINGNNSAEHRQLKEFLSELFGFRLYLESSGEYKLGSLESMFLPYYAAQDYGWVLVLRSFRGLEYFKNFKVDYYDYYLGVTNEFDRIRKQELEKERRKLENEIKFLQETERSDVGLELSRLKDDQFVNKAVSYIEQYKKNKEQLINYEKSYIQACNRFTFLNNRLKVLRRVKTALLTQRPIDSACPTCQQGLPGTVEKIYEHFQDLNDTDNQIELVKLESESLKDLKGEINSLQGKIEGQRALVARDYSVLLEYKIEDLTFNTWVDNKVNVQLGKNVAIQLGEKFIKLELIMEELKQFKSDAELQNDRSRRDFEFKKLFEAFIKNLKVKEFDDKKYLYLYQMTLFPKQGVELLLVLLAYYFAFNKVIQKTGYVHRLPFMLDAVFKEDVDDENKNLILNFIAKNRPLDTQTIFSIADSKANKNTGEIYHSEIFNNEGKLILIDKENTRAFLSPYKDDYDEILRDTFEILMA